METIFELVEKYGTDKTLSGYTSTYDQLFEPIKNNITSVLEIGLGTLNPSIPSSFVGNTQHFSHYKPGGSLRVWKDFFPNAQVYGVDIAKDCMFEEDRIKTFLFDSSDNEYTEYYLNNLEFDIIIDDGNHDPQYQIKTLKNLFPKLKEKGYYIIEDILMKEKHLFDLKINEWKEKYPHLIFNLLCVPSTINDCDNNLLVVYYP
jgi:hypothetical protein